ncbi:MAG: hypothetical protein ACE5FY_03015 [Nitrospiria bacterium]
MIIRIFGYIALVLIALSVLDHFGMIQITAIPLKQAVDGLIRLGNAVKEGISSL